MGKYTSPHARMSELVTLMSSEIYMGPNDDSHRLTMRKIKEITGIPENVLKKDLELILSDKCLGPFIKTDIEATYDKDDEKKEIHSTFIKMLKRGNEEALDVCMGLDYHMFEKYTSPREKPIFFTPLEKNLYAKIMHRSDVSDAVWIKDAVFTVSKEIMDTQDRIQEAIRCGHPISFHYLSQEGERNIKCLNVRRVYETLDNKRVYCIAFDNDGEPVFYRLDRISDLEVEEGEKMPPQTEKDMDFLDHIWGADATQEDVFHVKVKIYKETKNIYTKIKEDTKERKNRKLYDDDEADDIAYYEDEVSGKNSFKKWLRRYGASVVVLEPLWLAKEMYQSALRRMEAYKKLEEEI